MIFNLTHYDLDGIVSHMILSHLTKDVRFFATTYGKRMNNTIESMLDLAEQECPKGIIVTDLSLTEEQFNILNDSKIPFLIFDHHQNSLQYIGKKKGLISEEKCGSALVFDYYDEKLKKLSIYEDLKRLVYLTNDYDMWYLSDKKSYYLNLLFWRYKEKKFVKKFYNGFVEFDKKDKFYIKDEINKKRNLIESGYLLFLGENNEFICLIHDKAHTVASDFKLYVKGHKIYCTFSRSNYSMSIRWNGIEPNLNIPMLLEPWIHEWDNYIHSFGGHPFAASIQFDRSILFATETFSKITQKIFLSFMPYL